jgi:hypothetical protein
VVATPFLGSAYVSRSQNLADQQLINAYGEIVEIKSGKAVGGFYMAPGLIRFGTYGNGPIRGSQIMGAFGYVVSGNEVYRVTSVGDGTKIGEIGTNSGPVSIINNGLQLLIVDGIAGYLTTSSAIVGVAFPFANPKILSYQDGFGLCIFEGSQIVAQSDLDDLSTWSALNFSAADATPANLVSIAEVNREEWMFKTDSTEVWIDAGLAGFAFQRLEGVFIETGCAAPFSPALAGESLIWLSRNLQGEAQVVHARGYQAARVSTHYIEREIESYSRIDDAIGFTYQQEGHLFYVLTFPTGNATWVYDVTTSRLAGMPMWHRRAAFNNGAFDRHWANSYVFAASKHLVGDYRNGNLYALDLNAQTDDGSRRKWLRSWRATPQPVMQPVRFDALAIDMQTGMGVPPFDDPQLVLRWSDDGGHNWSNERFVPAAKTGATAQRVIFRRLGSTRRNSGLDRTFELSSTDRFDVALIGAEVNP